MSKINLYNIDCIEFMKDKPDNYYDMVLTSPPYDDLREYGNNIWNFEIFKKIANEIKRILKDGGVCVWIVGDETINGSESGTSFEQALYFKKIGFNIHDTMIYSKAGFAFPSTDRYHQTFEYMFIFSNGKLKTFNPIKDRKNYYNKRGGDCKRQKDGSMKKGDKGGQKLEKNGMRYNIWNYVIGGGNVTNDKMAYEHPAIFPEKLARDHIISWSNKGNIILDPFMGSGTVAKMCYLLNRNFDGCEIHKPYFEIAKQRYLQCKKNDPFDICNS